MNYSRDSLSLSLFRKGGGGIFLHTKKDKENSILKKGRSLSCFFSPLRQEGEARSGLNSVSQCVTVVHISLSLSLSLHENVTFSVRLWTE